MTIGIRPARREDVPPIVALEHSVFPGDRLSRRSFQRFLRGRSAAFLVAAPLPARQCNVAGYAVTLFRQTSSIARLYSVAVSPDYRGKGVARRLIEAVEEASAKRGKTHMRLEVRADNKAAITLYLKLGYKKLGHIPKYYDDGTDALRFEKTLK